MSHDTKIFSFHIMIHDRIHGISGFVWTSKMCGMIEAPNYLHLHFGLFGYYKIIKNEK